METSPRVDAVPSQRENSRPNKSPTPKSKVHKEKRGVSKKLWNEIVQVFEYHFHWGVILYRFGNGLMGMVPVYCSCMHGPDKAWSPIGSFWSPQLLLPSHMPTFFQSNCLQPNKEQDEELASEDMNRLTLHLIMIT